MLRRGGTHELKALQIALDNSPCTPDLPPKTLGPINLDDLLSGVLSNDISGGKPCSPADSCRVNVWCTAEIPTSSKWRLFIVDKGLYWSLLFFDIRSWWKRHSAGHYEHYVGSLTTPPCSEGVQWYVATQPGFVTDSQILDFEAAVTALQSLSTNARPLQPVRPGCIDIQTI